MFMGYAHGTGFAPPVSGKPEPGAQPHLLTKIKRRGGAPPHISRRSRYYASAKPLLCVREAATLRPRSRYSAAAKPLLCVREAATMRRQNHYQQCIQRTYSYRNAISGSTFVARRAGM